MRRRDLLRVATLVIALTMAIGMVGCKKNNNEDKAEVTSQEETKPSEVSTNAKEDGSVNISTTNSTGETVEHAVAADEEGEGTTALTEADTAYVSNEGGEVAVNEPAPEPQTEAPQIQPTETEAAQATPSGPDLSWYGVANPGDKTGCYDGFVYDESLVYSRIMAMKNYYPDGTPWDGSYRYLNRRVEGGKGLGTYWGGGGCNAFACMLSDAAFGNAPSRQHSDLDAVKIGDVIYYWNDTDQKSGHVFVVTEVKTGMVPVDKMVFIPELGRECLTMVMEPGTIFVCAEGNTNSKVYWGMERAVDSLKDSYSYIIYTRY